MRIFTQSIAFLTTDDHRSSVVSFLTCLRYIFNSSVIPEILSYVDPELFGRLFPRECKEESAWYRLFARSHTMQFSPTLIIPSEYCSSSVSPDDDDDDENPSDGFMEEILLPLKKNMKYFSCTLQRCEIHDRNLHGDREGILALLADVRSLTHLEFQYCKVHINEFLSLFLASSSRNQLEQLTVYHQLNDEEQDLREGIEGCFRCLHFLRLCNMEHEDALALIKHCPNLRTLIIDASWVSVDKIFDLVPKLTTLKVDDVDDEVPGFFSLCDKLPELTSLDLESAYGGSQLHNIDFLHDKPWIQKKLRVLKVHLSEKERINTDEQLKKYDCVKDCLWNFRNLTLLDLRNFGGQLNDNNFGHLVHLGFLRQFRIVAAEITSKGLFELALLAGAGANKSSLFTNLENIEISYCKLGGTDESPQHFFKFFSCCASNKLESLQLCANDLSDADLTPELVAEWKRCGVKKLSLGGNTGLSYSNDDDDDDDDNNDTDDDDDDDADDEDDVFDDDDDDDDDDADDDADDDEDDDEEDDNSEKKNGLVNLSQLTSITSLNLRGLKNLRGLNFLANMQQLRELIASFIPKLKSSAMKVFSQHRNGQKSFPHLRTINLQSSCKCNVLADEVLELLLENENIKLRLTELNLAGMSFTHRYHAFKEQFKGVEYFDGRVLVLEPPSD